MRFAYIYNYVRIQIAFVVCVDDSHDLIGKMLLLGVQKHTQKPKSHSFYLGNIQSCTKNVISRMMWSALQVEKENDLNKYQIKWLHT